MGVDVIGNRFTGAAALGLNAGSIAALRLSSAGWVAGLGVAALWMECGVGALSGFRTNGEGLG
jgi:hypothetical protein